MYPNQYLCLARLHTHHPILSIYVCSELVQNFQRLKNRKTRSTFANVEVSIPKISLFHKYRWKLRRLNQFNINLAMATKQRRESLRCSGWHLCATDDWNVSEYRRPYIGNGLKTRRTSSEHGQKYTPIARLQFVTLPRRTSTLSNTAAMWAGVVPLFAWTDKTVGSPEQSNMARRDSTLFEEAAIWATVEPVISLALRSAPARWRSIIVLRWFADAALIAGVHPC